MTVVRAPRPENGFLMVRNDVARDERLSYKARGVLIAILSLPDDAATSAEEMAARGPDGRTAILSAFSELRDAGYMRSVRHRNDKGQITTSTYVYDQPKSDEPESENLTSAPTRANGVSPLVAPKAGYPESGNPTPKKDPTTKTKRPSAPRAEESADQGSSQTLVAEWIDHCKTKPPSRVIGQMAKQIKTLLDEGYKFDDVRQAVVIWQNDKGGELSPALLPSLLHAHLNGSPRTNGHRRPEPPPPAYVSRPAPKPEDLPWAPAGAVK